MICKNTYKINYKSQAVFGNSQKKLFFLECEALHTLKKTLCEDSAELHNRKKSFFLECAIPNNREKTLSEEVSELNSVEKTFFLEIVVLKRTKINFQQNDCFIKF